jgi:hypothetical protein
MRRSYLSIAPIIALSVLVACAGLSGREPVQVSVAGIEQLPVTVSTLRVALSTLGFVLGDPPADKVRYKLSGKLAGPSFGSTFQSDGELALPTTP